VKSFFGLAALCVLGACQSDPTQLAECRLSSHRSTLTTATTEADVIDRAKALSLQIQHTPLGENCCAAFAVKTNGGELPEAMRSFAPAESTRRRAREVGLTSYTIVRVYAIDRHGQQQTLWFELDRCGNQLAL
jgi:hypothetical protein